MIVAHLLCTEGITGELWLGALVDAGADLDVMRSAVTALDIGPIDLSAEQVRVRQIAATRVRVKVGEEAPRLPGWRDLRMVVEEADLDGRVQERSLAVARRLAEAEASVHRVALDDVRFHELGDADTVVEIVGTVAGLRSLGIERVTCGPVAVGSGTVDTAHGRLPVPPPAVVELLHGFVVHAGDHERELTTPTGAALLAGLATPVDRMPPMLLRGRGRGASGGDDGSTGRIVTALRGAAVGS